MAGLRARAPEDHHAGLPDRLARARGVPQVSRCALACACDAGADDGVRRPHEIARSLQLEQIAWVVDVEVRSGTAGQHLPGLRQNGRLRQFGEGMDGPRELTVPVDARAGGDP